LERTIPFTFEIEMETPVWCFSLYQDYVYAGTGSDGILLKSKDRQFWSQVYIVDDLHVKSLLVQNNTLFIGTAPKGIIYTMDLETEVVTLSQELGGTVIGFCYFKGNMYAITSSPSQVYKYDSETLMWDTFYKPYTDVVNQVFIYENRMYLFMESEDIVYFDGIGWVMDTMIKDNISSFRGISIEPYSHVTNKLIDRSTVLSTDGMDPEEVYDVFPLNYSTGVRSAVVDGSTLLLGTTKYSKLFSYFNSTLNKIYQTDADEVYSLLNLDVGVNLAAIDNKLYLVYCGDLPSKTVETTTTTTTSTTTLISYFDITYPNAGSYIEVGQTITIAWSSSKGVNDAISLDLMKGSVVSQSINAKTTNNGTYEWIVPSSVIPGNDYSIRITWLTPSTATSEIEQGNSGIFNVVYTVPSTTTTTTTIIDTSIPIISKTYAIPILELQEEHITSMIKDSGMGGILFSTSKGRILSCREAFVNAYLTGERKVYAEVKNGFGNESLTGSTDFFYALYNKIAEINEEKEVVKYKFEKDTSAILTDRITGIFISPIMLVKEDLGVWTNLIWKETKPGDTEIIICVRSADSLDDIKLMNWDFCFSSNSSDVLEYITRSLGDYDIKGKYIQVKVTMYTDKKNVTPTMISLSLGYTNKFALYFFTVKFSLENQSNLKRGLIAANITQPQNTEIKFGICDQNSADWNDYQSVDINGFFSMSNWDRFKVGIKMISYGDNIPEVAEFSLLSGGDKINLVN